MKCIIVRVVISSKREISLNQRRRSKPGSGRRERNHYERDDDEEDGDHDLDVHGDDGVVDVARMCAGM